MSNQQIETFFRTDSMTLEAMSHQNLHPARIERAFARMFGMIVPMVSPKRGTVAQECRSAETLWAGRVRLAPARGGRGHWPAPPQGTDHPAR